MKYKKTGKRQGPKETTGRFATRQELVSRVVSLRRGKVSIPKVSKDCEVSVGTVINLMKEADKGKDFEEQFKQSVMRNKWDANLTSLIY